MLEITERASEFLAETRSMQGVPENFGVRIFSEASQNGRSGIQVGFSDAPAQGDEIGESHGTVVFVAPEVNEVLADFVMDAEPSERGPALVLKKR